MRSGRSPTLQSASSFWWRGDLRVVYNQVASNFLIILRFVVAASDPEYVSFERLALLAGREALPVLTHAHVLVAGCGGVGSWAAEMLARSAVGTLTLIDDDTVHASNINRQLPALADTLGLAKVEVLASRLRQINPALTVNAWQSRITPDDLPDLRAVDAVIDAIDDRVAKAALIAHCHQLGRFIVVSGGAGGRWDPTAVYVDDLGKTRDDPLLRIIRKSLRRQYGFRDKPKWGIPAVVSSELSQIPVEKEGGVRGTFGPVTASFGMAACAEVIRYLLVRAGTGEG